MAYISSRFPKGRTIYIVIEAIYTVLCTVFCAPCLIRNSGYLHCSTS